ncbi:hypothetical protein, partial [Escherichia coli]|uniref:hypothetical protein n=1 Tax=Escherichia coli TaxID=562 RepID=UPI003A97CFA0
MRFCTHRNDDPPAKKLLPFAGNKLCQTIDFVNGLHDFITQLYATASTFTPSAGKITPVCRRISVCSF